jgi:transcription elongation factor S-II
MAEDEKDKEDDEDKDKDEDEEDKDDEKEDEEKEDKDKEKDEEEDEDEEEADDIIEFDEEPEPEPEPEPIRRRRVSAPGRAAAEAAALKPEITREDPADHALRLLCLRSLDFLSPWFPEQDIQALERAIFEVTFDAAQKTYLPLNWKSPLFCEAYRQNIRMVLSNLHPQSPVNNPRLLQRIQEGEFPLSALPTMTPYEMYPENWFELKDKLIQREQKILEGNKSRATDQFRCRRCQKRECTYYELQTRSADEPMTIFITCLNCGKEWRQGG